MISVVITPTYAYALSDYIPSTHEISSNSNLISTSYSNSESMKGAYHVSFFSLVRCSMVVIVIILGLPFLYSKLEKAYFAWDKRKRTKACTTCKLTDIKKEKCQKCEVGLSYVPCTVCEEFNNFKMCKFCNMLHIRIALKYKDNDPTYIPCEECQNFYPLGKYKDLEKKAICDTCPLNMRLIEMWAKPQKLV